jgi:hypothetical protein
MQLVAPNILEEARGLSPVLNGGALAVGLFLWLYGARGHRFWIALAMTAAAGLVGLYQGPAYNVQPLVAGLLLALAAGALALSLVRILLFIAGGFTALAALESAAPGWGEPIVTFLVGGLGGIFLYRFWITTLTSLCGTLLIAYSSLCLLDRFRVMDAPGWSGRNGPLLNWACAAGTVLGVVLQFLLERRRKRLAKEAKAAREAQEAEEAAVRQAEETLARKPRSQPAPTLWGWVKKYAFRQAG